MIEHLGTRQEINGLKKLSVLLTRSSKTPERPGIRALGPGLPKRISPPYRTRRSHPTPLGISMIPKKTSLSKNCITIMISYLTNIILIGDLQRSLEQLQVPGIKAEGPTEWDQWFPFLKWLN